MKDFSNIIPLFWVKGESPEVLLDGLARLREAGIHECIVEARPFPKWLEKEWFDCLQVLFAEAARTKMRLWLFDDSHFPSGFAGGRISSDHKKQLLRCQCIELPGAGSYRIPVPCADGERLFQAVLAEYQLPDGFDGGSARVIPLPENGRDLEVRVSTHRRHRLFLMIRTREFGEGHTREWVNMLSMEAVRQFIDIVYEEHYRQLESYAQSGVLAGFFSDEPRFGSVPSYTSLPDGKSRTLPFSDDLARRLVSEDAAFWPALWHEAGELTPRYRAHFMDAVSKCYSQCFPQQIGAWCRAHQLQYIGHTIEDNGAHCRVGYGTGHYFRTMTGQDMAMVDSVLHQNLIGACPDGFHETNFGGYDTAFYHWGLGKLASSAAHLMPEFSGRAGCECFGAYGWNFGLAQMKQMTDHFAVRGINCFIPHAFSNAPFPDSDCPPHFYARGKNPQWPYFHYWREYCDRLCNLLKGGTHLAGTAVIYHAEAEWSTRPCKPFQSIGGMLLKNQLDFDVVPFDLLKEAAVVNGVMMINGEQFTLLSVPEYSWLDEDKKVLLNRLKNHGLALCTERDVVEVARKHCPWPVSSNSDALRVYRYKVGDEVRLLLVNESLTDNADFVLPPGGTCWYDALTDREYQWHDGGILTPGESLFAIYRKERPAVKDLPEFPQGCFLRAEDVYVSALTDPMNWRCVIPKKILEQELYVDCGEAGGVAIVTWNGQELPPRIAPPYRWRLLNPKEENLLTVRIIPTVDPKLGGIFDRGIAVRCSTLAADGPQIVVRRF